MVRYLQIFRTISASSVESWNRQKLRLDLTVGRRKRTTIPPPFFRFPFYIIPKRGRGRKTLAVTGVEIAKSLGGVNVSLNHRLHVSCFTRVKSP